MSIDIKQVSSIHWKEVAISTLVFLVSLSLSLLGAELALRLKHRDMTNYDIEMWRYARELKRPSSNPLKGHEHIPGRSAVIQSVLIRINSQGMRGPEISPATPGTRRILVLGDSLALGWGVPEEDTMVSLLEQKFSREGQHVEVLNGGVGNYNTQRSVEWFLTELTELKPTDIVVDYFMNDAEILSPSKGNFLLEHSQLAVMLWMTYHRLVDNHSAESLETYYHRMYQENSPGYLNMKNHLEKLSEYAKQHHIRLYLTMMRETHTFGALEYPYWDIHEKMRRLATELCYSYVDFAPGFAHVTPESIWVISGDPHPNAEGQQIMADILYPVLKQAES